MMLMSLKSGVYAMARFYKTGIILYLCNKFYLFRMDAIVDDLCKTDDER